jgi:hypothetical protein
MLEHNLAENLDSVDSVEFRELTHKIGNKELEVVLKVVRVSPFLTNRLTEKSQLVYSGYRIWRIY